MKKKINIKDLIIIILSLIILSLVGYIIYDKLNTNNSEINTTLKNFNMDNINNLEIHFKDGNEKIISNNTEMKSILTDIDDAIKENDYDQETNLNNLYIKVIYKDDTSFNIIFINDTEIVINYPFSKTTLYVLQNQDYVNNLIRNYD